MKKWILFSLIILIGFVILLFVPFDKRIFPNIYSAGIYLGDKSKTESLKIFEDNFKIPEKFTIVINNQKSEILTSEIITNINYKETIDRAYFYTSSGNYFTDFITRIKTIYKPVNLYPSLTVDENKLKETLLILSDKKLKNPVYPSVSKSFGKIIINSGEDGSQIDIEKTRNNIISSLISNVNEINAVIVVKKVKLTNEQTQNLQHRAESLIGKKIVLKLDHDVFEINDDELISYLTADGFSDSLIESKISEISKKLNRGPQNSVFIIENEKVKEFIPSIEGIVVDEKGLLKLIKELNPEIAIPVIKTSPKIKNEDVNNLGIKTLIGKGLSNFKGSIPNRIHNVNLAQSKFKGVLIYPDETVSFNKILGDVSSYTGYKSAYVIKDGRTVLGDGGGVCQVSTTLFRAVLDAGLPVAERKAHAYRVGYYEQGFAPGLDATVYSPTTDFKFKNNTPAYLLIQPTIDLNNLSLTFEIYGTNDGRIVTLTKPIVTSSVAPASDLYVDDPTLKQGVIKQIEHRAYGAKVIFDYKVTRNNETLTEQRFVSNYRPWQAVYLRGTAI